MPPKGNKKIPECADPGQIVNPNYEIGSKMKKNESYNLWCQSGGRCNVCKVYLLKTHQDEMVSVGQEAHIISEKEKGPRGALSDARIRRLDSVGNRILLCCNCHKLVDTDTNFFTPEKLVLIKQQHEEIIKKAFFMSDMKSHQKWELNLTENDYGGQNIELYSHEKNWKIYITSPEKFDNLGPLSWGTFSSTEFKYWDQQNQKFIAFTGSDNHEEIEFGINEEGLYIIVYTYDPWNADMLFSPFVRKTYSFSPYKGKVELLYQPAVKDQNLASFKNILDQEHPPDADRDNALYAIRDLGISNLNQIEEVETIMRSFQDKNWVDGATASEYYAILKELATVRAIKQSLSS